jgi:hypothetical protein
LIKIVTVGLTSERSGCFVNLVWGADEVAASPKPLDGLDLLATRLFRHHSKERQVQKLGEIGLADRGGSG